VGAHSSSSSKNPQLQQQQQQQQQQRARGNEINTAKREKIGFALVDLLYSDSLTKRTRDIGVLVWCLREIMKRQFGKCENDVLTCWS
jgi:hypothetical protein